jgi:hypothetical protein
VDPGLYDRDLGAGTFRRVVDGLRAGKAAAKEPMKPKGYKCPTGGGKFSPYGDEMIPGNPDTVLCSQCPMMLRQHTPYY